MGRFRSSTAIITGGASGIGRAVGEELARRGALVVLADIDGDLAEETAAGIVREGGRAEGVHLDVTDAEAVKTLVEGVARDQGRLDYLTFPSSACPQTRRPGRSSKGSRETGASSS